MKKLRVKDFIPFPSNDGFEHSIQIIAELYAENYFWDQKIWYFEQKIKESEKDEISIQHYKKLIRKIIRKCNDNYELSNSLIAEINSITGWRRKIAKKIFKLSNEIIEKNKRSNVFFEIPNHPFPFPNKLNYK